ncbi:J domain-containing protein [Consotaella salsifontis]|uniref:DnaJ domain-containing protein n=1 Tax=Consotaella salsifontis TaxID=1365950 RepID=A0A1T4QN21_9HYPH|nr:J domain-containing protein [Consotaella salsifontis]SKA05094.1 DnaJ domain-containing protein [Consotaella salsifontis]
MKLDSKYFDRIRLRPDPLAQEKARAPGCEWEGCEESGIYRAPRGRDHEGEYYHFCVDHVRLYNKSYNYFSGLGDKDIQAYLKDSMTGHRPTWGMGSNSTRPQGAEAKAKGLNSHIRDPYNLFGEADLKRRFETRRKKVRSLEAKAFEALDLTPDSDGEAIRMRYKNLVKRYHPDANGGDRGSEDRLREVIQAYKLLKQSGFC